MDIIRSISNDNIKLLRKLYDKKYRNEYGLYVAEGVTLIESMPDDIHLHSIFVSESQYQLLSAKIERFDCRKFIVEDQLFLRITETITPSGITAIVVKQSQSNESISSNCLILDRISDPGNLGTIIRTACACNYNDIYLIDCADAYSGKAVRASMGGIFLTNLLEINNINAIINNIYDHEIIALDMDGVNIYDYKPTKSKKCIIVGNEAHGISNELINVADKIMSIPMNNKIESLNAAVAAGIAMYMLGGK